MIVSDTGAIITLEKIPGGFDFIRKLYNKIIIPNHVLIELSDGNQYKGNYLDFYKVRDLFNIEHSVLINDLFDVDLGFGCWWKEMSAQLGSMPNSMIYLLFSIIPTRDTGW